MEPKKKRPARRAVRPPKAYHHGDLATALVEAAEAVLTERGVEGFTLRECARRAGVSHAAPAHHFKDAKGLLTEVARVGFDRLTEAQRAARAAEPELKDLLIAAAVGYIRFALTHPAQFQLMFQRGLIDHDNGRFIQAARAAFAIYVETYSAVTRETVRLESEADKTSNPRVLGQWALIHGLATLAVQGQLGPNRSVSEIAKLTAYARSVLMNAQKLDMTRR
jgi:AcrR family transcriptional regulator